MDEVIESACKMRLYIIVIADNQGYGQTTYGVVAESKKAALAMAYKKWKADWTTGVSFTVLATYRVPNKRRSIKVFGGHWE